MMKERTTNRRLTAILLGVSTLALHSVAGAQTDCAIEESIADCWEKGYRSALAEVREDAQASLEETSSTQLQQVDSGLDVADAGMATSLQNTLSRLGFTGLFNDSDADGQDEGIFALDLNFLLPGPVRARNAQLKMVVNNEPELFEPLRMLLPEAERDQRTGELEEQIGQLEDYGVVFKYNLRTDKKIGRSAEQHQDLLAALFEEIDVEPDNAPLQALARTLLNLTRERQGEASTEEGAGSSEQGEQDTAPQESDEIDAGSSDDSGFSPVVKELPDDPGKGEEQATLLVWAGDDEEVARSLGSLVFKAGQQEGRFDAQLQAAVEDNGLTSFADLANNQPQLLISAERRLRGDLVGPDEMRFEVAWEQPLGKNINRFLKKVGGIEDCQANKPPDCLAEFSNYTEREGTVDNADRAVFALTYTDIGDYSIFRPNDGLAVDGEPFRVEGGERLKVLAGWGRSFDRGPAEEALAPSRLDIALSYEDLFDDPERQDRFLASLTYTVKLNDGMSLPFGVVYANKPEFLAMEDIDEEISARLGLKFTLPGGNPQENGDGSN